MTVKIKLLPDHQQAELLRRTLRTANAACNHISRLAWEAKAFDRYHSHYAVYHQTRAAFPDLSSQMIVRATGKVLNAYKAGRIAERRFGEFGGFPYDNKLISWNRQKATMSIWAIGGRINIPFECRDKIRERLPDKLKTSHLCGSRAGWYLFLAIEVPDAAEGGTHGWLGIDLGLVKLAQSSDGHTFGNAGKVAGIRKMRWRQRKRLQSKGTRSARRVLRRLRSRESRFVRDTNHTISKQICDVAKRTGRGIALEDLRGIRERIRARKNQRRALHSWAFYDLQSKIAYKGRLLGISVKFIDPRNTSRTCPSCGHIAKANRKTRDVFECVGCGFTADADTNGAENIRLAAINQPNARKGVREHVASLDSLSG